MPLLRPVSFFAAFVGLAVLPGAAEPSLAEIPITGKAVPGMESADEAFTAFLTRHGIPGGSLSVMNDGRLVYARGFGWADRDARRPVQPETRFRIASLSKPITSLAIATLVQQGKLRYDQKVFSSLRYPTPQYDGAARDPRLDTITVRHLLEHSGGWNRDTALDPDGGKGFDPMFYTKVAARDLTGVDQPPATAEQVARWMVGKPLQFDPGTRYAYSNLGYCLLGRLIETTTSQPYETFTRSLLAKADITAMQIGGSRASELRENETRYYDFPHAGTGLSAWKEPHTPGPYRHSVPTMDAHGGWIASPTDLVRFTTLLDGRSSPDDLLNAESIATLHARPSFAPTAAEDRNFYGLGWKFWESKDSQFRNWFHSGSLPGTMAMLIRSDHGITWAALFNLRPANSSAAFKDLDATMWKAVGGLIKQP